MKIGVGNFTKIDKLILTFIRKCKGPRKAKTILIKKINFGDSHF